MTGEPNNRIASRYVEPLVRADGAQQLLLHPDTPWMERVLDMALEIVELHLDQPYGYELSVVRVLVDIWHEIAVNRRQEGDRPDRTATAEEQIAERIGFGDVNYFATKFCALFGMAPSAHRKRLRAPTANKV